MVHTYHDILCLYDVNRWQFFPDLWPVNVPVDSSEWAYLTKRVQEAFACEVPCVNDHISARELVKDLPRQAVDGVRVRIRNDTYPHKCSPVAPGSAVLGF